MLSQNSSQVNFAQRAEVPQLIDGADSKITEDAFKRKCPFSFCNKIDCRKFWHKPCGTYDPGFVGQLWPTVLAVGITEIFFGGILLVIVIAFRWTYVKIYGIDAGVLITLTSILGLLTLVFCGVMLIVSLLLDNAKIMWFRIMTSTGWSAYVLILSVLKMHFALLANDKGTLITNNSISLRDAGMLEVFTLLGAVFHFFGDIAVFTYYHIRFLQPLYFNSDNVQYI